MPPKDRKAKILFEDKSVDGIDIRAFKKPQDGMVCLQLLAMPSGNGMTIRMNPEVSANQFRAEMERVMAQCQQHFFKDFIERFGKHEA